MFNRSMDQGKAAPASRTDDDEKHRQSAATMGSLAAPRAGGTARTVLDTDHVDPAFLIYLRHACAR